jgi:hypothetical protein
LKGKVPQDKQWTKHPLKYNDRELANWIYDGNNHGVCCGWGGVTVIDIDDLALLQLPIVKELQEVTFCVRTPSGGLHIYFICPLATPKTFGGKGEIRSTGQQVVAPYSEGYKPANDLPLSNITILELKKYGETIFGDSSGLHEKR